MARYGFQQRDAPLPRSSRRLALDDAVLARSRRAPTRISPWQTLDRLVEAAGPRACCRRCAERAGLRRRLVAVLGASAALGDHLVAHPEDWRPARATGRASICRRSASRRTPTSCASRTAAALLVLAARDLAHELELWDVCDILADLAGRRAAGRAGPGPRRAGGAGRRTSGSPSSPWASAAAQELNYFSDVDVIFVGEAGRGRRAAALSHRDPARRGGHPDLLERRPPRASIFPIDANLRPEGRQGPLVRTLASHEAYYQRWAHTWEYQALLKARPVAGDVELGGVRRHGHADGLGRVDPPELRRRRAGDAAPGRGEHPASRRSTARSSSGPAACATSSSRSSCCSWCTAAATRRVHSPRTLPALAAADRRRLRRPGRLRRRSPTPTSSCATSSIGCSCSDFGAPTSSRPTRSRCAGSPGASASATWTGARTPNAPRHAREVRRLHEKLFYRPLLDGGRPAAPPTTPASTPGSTPEGSAGPAAGARLRRSGERSRAPAGAVDRAVAARPTIQRVLLPAMLDAFADAADPDAGLLAYRQVSDALGRTPWYLRLLRDEGGGRRRWRAARPSGWPGCWPPARTSPTC